MNRIDALIQIPIIDLRSFLAAPSGKLSRPAWPVGIVGEGAGESQFVRGFSALQNTLGAETGNWEGRAQHVDARTAFKLPADFDRQLQMGIAASAPVSAYTSDFYATCLSRAFYGSQTSPRNFLQVRFRLNDPAVYQKEHWEAALAALLALPVRVPGDGAVPMSRIGGPLAACIRTATTKARFRGRVPSWAVTNGRLLVMLEVSRRDGDEMPSPEPDLNLEGSNADLWILPHPNVEACVVVNRNERKRALAKRSTSGPAIHLSRLHSERVTLTKLASALISHKPSLALDDGGDGVPLLRSAFEEVTGYLGRKVAFGNDQRSLLELLDSDLALHGAEWEALNRTLNSVLSLVAQDVVNVITIIEGDNVEGDKFQNVRNSTIINRSTVQDSFNALDEASLGSLRTELEVLVKKVEELDDPEASEVAEAFVEESGGARRPGALKGLWGRLQEVAPAVSGLATAGTAIAKLLLGVP